MRFTPWSLIIIALLTIGIFSSPNLLADTKNIDFPIPLDAYQDQLNTDLKEVLLGRILYDPFNLIVSIIFCLAIIHTFLAGKIYNIAHVIEARIVKKIKEQKRLNQLPSDHPEHSILSSILIFLGEVEIIFSLWVIVLGVMFVIYKDWAMFLEYLEHDVVFTEPLFVVVIMTIASTRPITDSAERMVTFLAKKLTVLFRSYSGAFWFSTLFFGGLLGSFITEVASITIASLIISAVIFKNTDNEKFKYLTLGILLVNISVGGALTHFAAPVVLIVANKWGLTTPFMFQTFGAEIIIGTFSCTLLGYFWFRKEFKKIDVKLGVQEANKQKDNKLRVPLWIILVHYFFIIWSVVNAHHHTLLIAGYLFLFAFVIATRPYQKMIDLRPPLLIGLFLAGLVVHGGLQGWWIVPILSSMGNSEIFWVSMVLSAINDNASVSFLSSLIPQISEATKIAVLSGALSAGGLTILANAPNPTAFSILRKDFKRGISHIWLALAAIPPTAVMVALFLLG